MPFSMQACIRPESVGVQISMMSKRPTCLATLMSSAKFVLAIEVAAKIVIHIVVLIEVLVLASVGAVESLQLGLPCWDLLGSSFRGTAGM